MKAFALSATSAAANPEFPTTGAPLRDKGD
jgi:hypothetical protein